MGLNNVNSVSRLANRGKESKVYNNITAIDAGATEIVLEVTGEAEIQACEFITDLENVEFYIYPATATGGYGSPLNLIPSSANYTLALTPANLRSCSSSVFELLKDEVNVYKIGIKRNIHFGNGFKITRKNPDTENARKGAINVYYTIWG